MHVAALIGRLRENLAQCCPQAGMIVGHDKFDAMQTTGLQPEQEIAPARPALAVGELDRQHLTAAVPVDADRDQHRLAGDHAGLAHPLVARVEDQIGEGFGQWRPVNCARLSSSRRLIALIEEAEKLWPHSSSVIAFTLRVETPCTYISASAATSARSER